MIAVAVILAVVAVVDIVVIGLLVALVMRLDSSRTRRGIRNTVLREELERAEHERDRLREEVVRLRRPRPAPSPTIGDRLRGPDSTVQFKVVPQ